MKNVFLILALFSWAIQATGQEKTAQQLKKELDAHPQQDTFRVNRLIELSRSRDYSLDEREKFAAEALSISRKTGYQLGEGYALANIGFSQFRLGNTKKGDSLLRQADTLAKKLKDPELIGTVLYSFGHNMLLTGNKEGLDYLLKAEETFEKSGIYKRLALCQMSIAEFYKNNLSNYPSAMEYLLKATHSAEKANSSSVLIVIWDNLGNLYTLMGDYANALMYYKKADEESKKSGIDKQSTVRSTYLGEIYRLTGKYAEAIQAYNQSMEYASSSSLINIEINESNLADVYTRMGNLPLAFQYGFHSLALAKQLEDDIGITWIHGILARAYLQKGMPDSSIYYARPGLDIATQTGTIEYMRDNAAALADAYAFKKDFANAYRYHLQYINYRDSMLSTEVRNKTAVLQYNSDLNKKQAQITQLNQQKKAQQNFLISALIVLMLIIITAGLLLRNNRQKQKANKLLQKQKKEIEDQRDQTNKALSELKQTQAQLVQSEKMASLGELTAGIAHEIQNPLNFVNNFSEVNTELLAELNEEIEKENYNEVKAIAKDVIDNEQKINHHGKRADAIVKGMLQHSRSSSGVKEPTDINALADEYLRLAYHGLRAKDKDFNATMKTDFDKGIGNINIIPQDIGRVILNLITNAFYAASLSAAGGGFKNPQHKHEPTVWLSTKKTGDKVLISVRDNGPGIPQKILDKIFQPFFTTKPTGQGTGLGLSLSYDIVKAHGGELRVETKEREGSEFIIHLPIS